jgi:fibronectin-binding autotransporter adhesin
MENSKIAYKLLFILSFLFSITVLSVPAMALYDVNNTGVSDVNGLSGDEVHPATGSEFGTVRAIADTNNAYALYGDGNDVEISGDFPVDGVISAEAGIDGAYGLYAGDSNMITTGNLNGTISAAAGNNYAYGLFANNSINVQDVNGTITASASLGAYGLRSYNDSITIGAIRGIITATADTNDAYGLSAFTSLTTGDIYGTITSTAGNENAYGLFANGYITTGEISGTITSSAYLGAYGLRSYNDSITTGAITGNIIATSNTGYAYGLSADTSLTTGDINGVITATAGNNYAYGLFANNSITTGDVNGTITSSAYLGAYGLRSLNNSITTGAITGNITATSDTDYAYGLSADTSITTGDINGVITATAGDNYAYGLYANDSITTGDVNGTITSSANLGAYGLRSYDSSITTGAITGNITATSDTDYAYGLSADTSITTGDINGVITADAVDNYAYGLFANNSITTGDVNGTITSSANLGAYGLRSNNSTINTGAIDGSITATADTNDAYGLSAYSSITTGAINGTITVDTGGDSAFGLVSTNGSISTGDIGGTIYITAGANNAYGLAADDELTTGNIIGTIDVMAETDNAYGMKSSNGPITIGNIDGDIYAYAKTHDSYGILSLNDQIAIGDIGGVIYARSDTNDAFGIYSYSDSVTTGDITGDVAAYAHGDYAYGILSYGPMDIKVDGGYIYGYAGSDSNYAAIQSGRIESGVLNSQNADDNVEITAGSRIVGDIDLAMNGTDNDILTLSGVDTNSTTLNYDLKNIETINLTGGTWHLNGSVTNNINGIEMTGGVLNGTGTLGSLNVTGGTLAPGNSIGTTNIDGDLTLGSDSTLEIEVDNSGHSDKLIVTGDAVINGSTLKTASDETISSTHEYTIIEANSVSGEFDVVDTAMLRTILSEVSVGVDYLTDSVILTVIPERFDGANFFTTSNQRSVGSALQQIADNGGNEVTTAIQQLTTVGQVRDAYDQLCGQTRISLASVSAMGNTRFADTVSNRLHNTQSVYSFESGDKSPLLAMAQPENKTSIYDTDTGMNSFAIGNGTGYFASEHWGLWGRGYSVFGKRKAETTASGYQYRIYGTGFGMDYKYAEDLIVGITGGYSIGSVDYSSSKDKSDIYSTPVGIYTSWFTRDWYIDSIFSFAPMEYETKRYIDITSETLKGKFDGHETSASMEAGQNWFLGKDYLVQPMASFYLSYLNLESYSETGGASAISFDEQIYKSYKGSLGMKVKRHLAKDTRDNSFIVELRGRWLHEFGDTESNIYANFTDNPIAIFNVSDSGLARDTAVVGVGYRQIAKENTIFFIDYDTSINQQDTSHIISAGFRFRW